MGARKGRAPECHTLLAAIKGRLAYKGATSEKIVATLKKDYGKAYTAELHDLAHIGLMKLAGAAGRSGLKAKAQFEMFKEYDPPRMVVLRVEKAKGHVQRVHKAVDALTIAEARQYILDNSGRPRSRRAEKITELTRLVDDVEQYGKSDQATIDECWAEACKNSV